NAVLEDESQAFQEVGMWTSERVSITGMDEPEEVRAIRLTHGTLPALGIQPALGRRFTVGDDSPGNPETAILSYGYWQTRFAGDPSVLGQTLRVDGVVREIIGVMPEALDFMDYDPDLYVPFQIDRSQLFVGNFSFRGVARLAPGVSLAQANADVARLLLLAVERYPGGITQEILDDARFAPDLRLLKEDVVGDVGQILWILLGTVGMVLLIACANVANLFLVRAEGREQEMAIRTAMGAGRGQVAREFLGESLTLGVLGGMFGVGLAWGGLQLLRAMGPSSLPRLDEVSLNGPVLLFTLGVSLVAGLFFGLFPVLKQDRVSLVGSLKEGGRGGSAGRERHRARNALVVGQMALALILLVGSGLMVRTFQALRSVDPGFSNPEEILAIRLSIPTAEVEDPMETGQTMELIQQRLRQIPGVTSVGVGTSVPMEGWNSMDPIFLEGMELAEGQLPPLRSFEFVSEGYLETLRISLVAGRALDWSDARELNRVVMVSENFAREYWDSPVQALGKRIATGLAEGNWREIVGVVADVHERGVDEDPPSMVYWPSMVENMYDESFGMGAIHIRRNVTFSIRSPRVGTAELLPDVREAVWSVNPNLPLGSVRTLPEIMERSMARTSFSLAMLGIAAGVALILGAIGIYGVVAYTVTQRTREIGVRLAMGAEQADVTRMVLRQGMILAGAGIGIGLVGALGLTRLMEAFLFGISSTDPMTFASVSGVLALVALLATWLPARRAARTDPVQAIRYE
ncbi:MAG: ABC transporter permease, partial [Longimicrobiales bacterium]